MGKKAKEHERLDISTKILLATGFGGLERQYPDYFAKFGEENVEVIRWDHSCTDIDSHLAKMKEHIPNDHPFMLCGHSLGGCLIIELLSRETFPNLKSITLVGASRKLRDNQGLDFMMMFPWFFLWIFAAILVFAFPITLLIWRKKTFDTYYELFKFLGRDGAKKIHKQYNLTLKKLGAAESILDPDIPLLIVRIPKDTLVDEEDLEFTKAMFNNVRERIIQTSSIHLIEKFDPITVENIAAEAEFLGLNSSGLAKPLAANTSSQN